MIKKAFKYIAWMIAGVLLLLLLLALFSQTAMFRQIVVNQTVKLLNNQLNAEVTIGQLNGNFYRWIELEDVRLRAKGDTTTMLSVGRISLAYQLNALLSKRLMVDSLIIDRPFVHARQGLDSTWNFAHLLPPSEDTVSTPKKPLDLTIQLDQFWLKNGLVTTSSQITQLPDTIKSLSIHSSFWMSDTTLSVHLKNFSATAAHPSIHIKQLSTHFHKRGAALSLDSLVLQTAYSAVDGHLNYTQLTNSALQLNAHPLEPREVALFVPSIAVPNTPRIKVNYEVTNDVIAVKLAIEMLNERMDVNATIHHLFAALEEPQRKVPYSATVQLSGVHPENWWVMPVTGAELNGTIELVGNDLLDYKQNVSLKAMLDHSSYHQQRFSVLRISGKQTSQQIDGQVRVKGPVGMVKGRFGLTDVYRTPHYSADLQFDSVNVSGLLKQSDTTLISGRLTAKGQGFEPQSMGVKGQVALAPSVLYNYLVDSAYVDFSLLNGVLNADTALVVLPGVYTQLKGKYSMADTRLHAEAQLSADSLPLLRPFIGDALRFKSMASSIQINGTLDSIAVFGTITSDDLDAYGAFVHHSSISFDGALHNNQPFVNYTLVAAGLRYDSLKVDSVWLSGDYANYKVSADLKAVADSIRTHVRTNIALGDTLQVELPLWDFTSPFGEFYLAGEEASFSYHQNDLTVTDLVLKNRWNPLFELKANGLISNDKEENFRWDVSNLDMRILNRLGLISEPVKGFFSSGLKLTGKPDAPVLDLQFEFKEPGYGNVSFSSIKGKGGFKDKKASLALSFPAFKDNFRMTADVPLQAGFDTAGFYYQVPKTFEAALWIDSLNVSQPLRNQNSDLQIEGDIKMDIKAKGTFDQPQFFGTIGLKNGRYINELYGLTYKNAQLDMRLDGNRIAIEEFLVKDDKGYLAIHGDAVFDSTMISGRLNSSTIKADASQFYLARNKNYTIAIDMDAFLNSLTGKNEFGGKIKVLRSDFYLPALMPDNDDEALADVPLLVQATSQAPDSAQVEQRLKALAIERQSNVFMDNLQGRLRLEIPRNTWLRSDEMKIEIWGDIEIEKSSNYFELFGEMGINRGHYIMYGKKFNITEGKIIFQGGETFDPVIDLKATYTYRGADKQKRNLQLQVNERLSEPAIAFTLDDEPIPDADAISILVTGKTMDEMSFSGQNGMIGAMGTNMVAQVMTSQLSKTIGTRFNLDMIEINATENWQSAAFVVGKYITNDLFVIYQRGFGETEGDEITPETVTLEYELNRFLFFRLMSGSAKDSGVDVILKFEPKKD